MAVAISDQVELLYSNGSLLGSAVQQFSNLKALTFDNIRHQLVVSDMDQKNDTIYGVQLTKQTDIIPIVQDLPDDVQVQNAFISNRELFHKIDFLGTGHRSHYRRLILDGHR